MRAWLFTKSRWWVEPFGSLQSVISVHWLLNLIGVVNVSSTAATSSMYLKAMVWLVLIQNISKKAWADDWTVHRLVRIFFRRMSCIWRYTQGLQITRIDHSMDASQDQMEAVVASQSKQQLKCATEEIHYKSFSHLHHFRQRSRNNPMPHRPSTQLHTVQTSI